MPDTTFAAPIPPDALALVVRYLNHHSHDGRSNWEADGDRGAISRRGPTGSFLARWLSAREAVAVACYWYGMVDPRVVGTKGGTP